MNSYTNVDKNLVVNRTIGDADVIWYDVRKAPFSLHGLYDPITEPIFRRLPKSVGDATSKGVSLLCEMSAGGRVRFSTDSPYIAIRARFRSIDRHPVIAMIAGNGFDLYTDGEFGSRYLGAYRMPYDMEDSYEQILHLPCSTHRTYTINFPLRAVVESLEIGLKPDASLSSARPYRNLDPIVVYGSSIVHGVAASRPGNAYPAILSRSFNMDVLNLGFSGKAKGEPVLAEWMAKLPMSVFVCDFDHNTHNAQELEAAHYPLYEIIRKQNPTVPYIMITRPNFSTCQELKENILQRREVVMRSYLRAREAGDRNVYFIDGMSFFVEPHAYEFTTDTVHPNDAGFIRMADSIGTVIRYILETEQ